MTDRNENLDTALEDVLPRSSRWKAVIFGVAFFCLASSLVGLFFLVTRLILPHSI